MINICANPQGQVNLPGAMELCCSFGMKMLTIETKEKLVCMANANPRKYCIFYHQNPPPAKISFQTG